MVYISNREKIKNYIDSAIDKIIIKNPDLIINYNSFINCIMSDLGVSKGMVEEILKSYLDQNKLIKKEELIINKDILIKKEDPEAEKEFKEFLNGN